MQERWYPPRIRGSEEQQRLFLRYGRPGAAAASLVGFGLFDLFAGSTRLDRLLLLLALALVLSGLSLLALRRWPLGVVARATLATDFPLIAAMTGVLGEPDLLAVPYFAPIAFAALMFGPRETAGYTVLGGVSTAVVGLAIHAAPITIFADVLVLGITGAVLAGLSREMSASQAELARERSLDAAALRLAARIRSSLDLESVLTQTVEELGELCGATRCLLRLAPRGEEWAPLYEWSRADVAPMGHSQPPEVIVRNLRSGAPLVVDDRERTSGELREFLDGAGAQAFVSMPVHWQDRVVALLGFHDDKPRRWADDALPLLERVVPQIAAALAQAELFEQQHATLNEFRELSRLREELIANVSHELRTPLTSVMGFLQTVQARGHDLDEDERAGFLGLALSEAERLSRLVDDLLELARLDRGVFTLALGPVDLSALLRRAGVGVDLEGRELRLDVPEGLTAHGDPDRLLQVFSNLLTNAARHGEGTIGVTASPSMRTVTVAISDGGRIPADRVSELFVPFARWGSRGDSTGLGLAIARGIVHAHGGTLYYRPGGGDAEHAFVVTLPRDAPTPPPVSAGGAARERDRPLR